MKEIFIKKIHIKEIFHLKDDGDKKTVKKIDEWFVNLENGLKTILEDPDLQLIFDRKEYNFYFRLGNGNKVTINQLSDGYASILRGRIQLFDTLNSSKGFQPLVCQYNGLKPHWNIKLSDPLNIITELIMRMEKKYPFSYGMQGIVLIDEIDAHLHVELQKKVLPFLSSFFPKIQFIVTTHSPFVISSDENCVIYDLEKNIRVEDATSYSYDTIIESYFSENKDLLEEFGTFFPSPKIQS